MTTARQCRECSEHTANGGQCEGASVPCPCWTVEDPWGDPDSRVNGSNQKHDQHQKNLDCAAALSDLSRDLTTAASSSAADPAAARNTVAYSPAPMVPLSHRRPGSLSCGFLRSLRNAISVAHDQKVYHALIEATGVKRPGKNTHFLADMATGVKNAKNAYTSRRNSSEKSARGVLA